MYLKFDIEAIEDRIREFMGERDPTLNARLMARAIATSLRLSLDGSNLFETVDYRCGNNDLTERASYILSSLMTIQDELRKRSGRLDMLPNEFLELFSGRAFTGWRSLPKDSDESWFPMNGELPRLLGPAMAGRAGFSCKILVENFLISMPGIIVDEDGRVARFTSGAIRQWVLDCEPIFKQAHKIFVEIEKVAQCEAANTFRAKHCLEAAKILKENLGLVGVEMKLGHCQELIALGLGAKNWNQLSAKLKKVEEDREAERQKERAEELQISKAEQENAMVSLEVLLGHGQEAGKITAPTAEAEQFSRLAD